MKKLSSESTYFYKKVFPVLWFGFLGLFLVIAVAHWDSETSPMFFVIPIVMAAFGYVLLKKVVWDLVDEVYDGWEYLLVKNRGKEVQIPLSEIVNINAVTMMNPPRITLRLNRPCEFGSEVSFSPTKQFTLNPFAKNEIAEDLIVRVDRARSKRAVYRDRDAPCEAPLPHH